MRTLRDRYDPHGGRAAGADLAVVQVARSQLSIIEAEFYELP